MVVASVSSGSLAIKCQCHREVFGLRFFRFFWAREFPEGSKMCYGDLNKCNVDVAQFGEGTVPCLINRERASVEDGEDLSNGNRPNQMLQTWPHPSIRPK